MIRTETQLREALDQDLDDEAADRLTMLIRELGERMPEVRRRRLQVLPAFAAAAVVAVVVLVAAVLARWSAGRGVDTPGGGDGAWTDPAGWTADWTFSVGDLPGYTFTRTEVARPAPANQLSEAAAIAATNSPATGLLVLRNSGSDTSIPSGESVSVNGHPGQFVPGTHVSQDGLVLSLYQDPWRAAVENHDHQPRLIWQETDGSWAELSGTFGFASTTYDYDNTAAESAMLEIARAVHTGITEPVRVPFAVAAMPAGFELNRAEFLDAVPCLAYDRDFVEPDGGGATVEVVICRVATGATDDATRQSANRSLPDSDGVVVRNLRDGSSILVSYPNSGDVFSKDDAGRVADELDVAPELNRPTTWFAVR